MAVCVCFLGKSIESPNASSQMERNSRERELVGKSLPWKPVVTGRGLTYQVYLAVALKASGWHFPSSSLRIQNVFSHLKAFCGCWWPWQSGWLLGGHVLRWDVAPGILPGNAFVLVQAYAAAKCPGDRSDNSIKGGKRLSGVTFVMVILADSKGVLSFEFTGLVLHDFFIELGGKKSKQQQISHTVNFPNSYHFHSFFSKPAISAAKNVTVDEYEWSEPANKHLKLSALTASSFPWQWPSSSFQEVIWPL